MAKKVKKISDKVLRRPKVEEKVGLSRSSIYLRIKNGTFPRPIKLGPRASGWLESEIDEWLGVRIEKRDHGNAA